MWCIIWKSRTNRRGEHVCLSGSIYLAGLEIRKEGIELPIFDLSAIATATSNFSDANLIGEGGLGPVYKVTITYVQKTRRYIFKFLPAMLLI